ncbi:MAG: tetratricopeptide repeat protein [Desulfobacteraceae bacterium]|nr:tetratricopeptide repeat protein [Desulfobacteraceae bacterium]
MTRSKYRNRGLGGGAGYRSFVQAASPCGRWLEQMFYLYRQIFLHLKLLWYHIVFYSFPTLEESYYTNLGITYFELGQYEKAIAKIKKSEDCSGDQGNAFAAYNVYYIGCSYLGLGNHRQALKAFDAYLAFDPENFEIIEFVGWCNLLLYQHEAALKNYLRLAKLEPANPIYIIESARILFELNKKNEARKQLDSVKKLNYGSALDLLVDSLKYRFKNELDNAILFMERALAEATLNKDELLYSQLGDLCIILSEYKKERGDLEGTIIVLENLCKIIPYDYWAINCLAFEYADQNLKLEKALGQINRCLKYQPENSFFIDTKGWILFKMGRVKEAKKILEKSLELNPNDKETLAHYREVKEQLNF